MAKYGSFKYGTAQKYHPNWMTPKTDWTSSDYYNYTDVNRVEDNTAIIKDILATIGYMASLTATNTGWNNNGFLYYDELNRIESNVLALKTAFYEPVGWITPKTDWVTGFIGNGYIMANRIETDILLLYNLAVITIQYLMPCGTFKAGSDHTRQHFTR